MIDVIVPSRGRPHAIAELRTAFDETIIESDDVRLTVVVDDDDPELGTYLRDYEPTPYHALHVVAHTSMVGALNEIAVRSTAEIVGFMGDDHRPRTRGWERRVIDALSAAPGVTYGNDLLQGPNLPTAAFITGDVVRALGYMAPSSLVHLYVDNFWVELGRATSLTYLGDVIIEHMHPVAGKAKMDEGYARVNAADVDQRDKAEFERYVREDWPTERLRIAS